MCLELSPTDRGGKTGSTEGWTDTVGFGLYMRFIDKKKNKVKNKLSL